MSFAFQVNFLVCCSSKLICCELLQYSKLQIAKVSSWQQTMDMHAWSTVGHALAQLWVGCPVDIHRGSFLFLPPLFLIPEGNYSVLQCDHLATSA